MKNQVLAIVLEEPGISRQNLRETFGLSNYRLNRVFRELERELPGQTIVHHPEHGVWLVEVNSDQCSGMNWKGVQSGGYKQCPNHGEFDDGCCYLHSACENPEMVAFVRKLAYLVGPAEPTPYGLAQLTLIEVQDLADTLTNIVPLTRKDAVNREKLRRVIATALSMVQWRIQRRRAHSDNWIPPEFRDRHGKSSVNPFEYSLKKHFHLLEVPIDAEKEEVLKAWKRLCRKYHPDVEGGDEDKMKQINLAKERIFRIRRWD